MNLDFERKEKRQVTDLERYFLFCIQETTTVLGPGGALLLPELGETQKHLLPHKVTDAGLSIHEIMNVLVNQFGYVMDLNGLNGLVSNNYLQNCT